MALVEVTRHGDDVAVVTMHDPARYNALTNAMVAELRGAFASLRADRGARVIVLAGSGRGFCAGANMTGDDPPPPETAGQGRVGFINTLQENLAALVLAIHEAPQPVIAAVHGGAVGGGFALSLASDLRIATTDAYFAAHFIRVGLSSCDVGTSYLLPRIVGPTLAMELMLTGRRVPATEAMGMGLLNRIVDADDLLASALDLAAMITANSEYGVYMTKRGMWANLDTNSIRHAMELENRTQVLGCFTGNMTEAGQAFVEKRPPRWNPM